MGRRRFSFKEPVVIALGALRAHKLRSVLTLLGVIISVFTLIGVMSIIEGLNRYIAERVADFGTNVFYVTRYPIITNAKDWLEARRRNPKMTVEDMDYLREHMTLAEAVGAQEWRMSDVRGGNESLEDVSIRGTTPNMIDISTENVASGRYITQGDYQRRTLVAFVGADLVEGLFPNVDPLGKTIWVKGLPFEIVGVAEKVGSVLGQSQDNFVFIPLTTLQKIWGPGPAFDSGPWIGIKCSSPDVMARAMDEARTLMRARRQQKFDERDRFGLIASESLMNLWDQIFGGVAAVAVGVVSVFLLVGGIVIMNIMLASVTERTREIGIRKSLGARRRDILLQFLVEASVLSTVGGVVGVLLALGATALVVATTPVPMRTPTWVVVLAVALAASVGLFFGVYPAQKAARLDPVVALRAE
ncbi:ABC transporter permease [Acidobacteriia bacterium AH_259_A11_L15]|nr:ABC transporter permease [Acidobacteriia bacterium AH_259_A11_L15]